MCAQHKPQPEHHKSIQTQWEDAQKSYSPSRAVMAVIASPDVPARSKVLLALSGISTAGIVVLGTSRSPMEAIAAVLACNLSIALLTKDTSKPRDSPRAELPRPPKPRPRRAHKK